MDNVIDRSVIDQKVAEAISGGDLSHLCKVLADANESLTSFRFRDGSSILHVSAATAPSLLTRELLIGGCSPNTQSLLDGTTPLHVAVSTGRLGTVELMLDWPGVDDSIKDHTGRTAYDLVKTRAMDAAFQAAQNRFIESQSKMLKQALATGGSVACEMVQQIFESPRARRLLNINELDRHGETLLQKAVRTKNTELVRILLHYGADPHAKSRKGKMALQLTSDEDIRTLLRQAPMQTAATEIPSQGTRLSGYLLKYINFASGYKRRFVVLDEGILSYYRTKEDYPVTSKGSVNVQFARVVTPPGDRLCFELRTPKYSLYFKTETQEDATRWIVALNFWQQQQRLKQQEKSATLDGKEVTVISSFEGQVINDSDASIDFMGSLRHAQESVDRLQSWLGATLASSAAALHHQHSSNTQQHQQHTPQHEHNTPLYFNEQASVSDISLLSDGGIRPGEELDYLKTFLQMAADREDYWQHRMAEDAQKLAKLLRQKSTGTLAAAGTGLQRLRSVQKLSEDIDQDQLQERMSDLDEDEFFDALVLDHEEGGEEEESSSVELVSPIASISEFSLQSTDVQYIAKHIDGYIYPHRIELPVGSDKIPPLNIWSIIKNAIGKDPTRIPLPVNFSEPLSMLQRLCEDLEYADLLWMASRCKDPMMRIQYVMAFAVSGYSNSDGRLNKPFNPMLGETFEFVSHDHAYTYVSEQVSHHPPISACICESSNFKYMAEVSVRAKFWGKSLELVPEGMNHVYLKTTGEHFSYRKVTTAVYNIIMGTMWLDHYGVLTVTNHNTGDVCEVEFHPTGWRTTKPNRVDGGAYDYKRNLYHKIAGFWNSHLTSTDIKSGQSTDIWRLRPRPEKSKIFYNFTNLTMALNECSDKLRTLVATTDSRLRPDQRAMEEGRFEEANTLKVQLEEKQRAKRRAGEEDPNLLHEPRWFRRVIEPDTKEAFWEYLGGYWESRQNANWINVSNIYLDDQTSSTITNGSITTDEESSSSLQVSNQQLIDDARTKTTTSIDENESSIPASDQSVRGEDDPVP